MKKVLLTLAILGIAFGFGSCSDDKNDPKFDFTQNEVAKPNVNASYNGFYVLNQGGFNSDNASVGFFNVRTGFYLPNIYEEVNPQTVKQLGDSGNDFKLYKGRVYAVMTGSNKVEVFNAYTAEKIGQIGVDGCRTIDFDDNNAYVSAFGEVNNVSQVDLSTLKVTKKYTAGLDPEGLIVHNKKLYVANSGGSLYPNCGTTVSVFNLADMSVAPKAITVALDPMKIMKDSKGLIYVASPSVFAKDGSPITQPQITVIDSSTDTVVDHIDMEASTSNSSLTNDKIYAIDYMPSYKVYDIATKVTTEFLTAEATKQIVLPMGVAVNPYNGDIVVADAINYNGVSGKVYTYGKDGSLKTTLSAGVMPSHIVFVPEIK